MALFGHGAMSALSPLSDVKRKLDFGAVRAAFDPRRKSASRNGDDILDMPPSIAIWIKAGDSRHLHAAPARPDRAASRSRCPMLWRHYSGRRSLLVALARPSRVPAAFWPGRWRWMRFGLQRG